MASAYVSLDEIDESLIARGCAKVIEVEIDGESILYDEPSQELLVLNGSAAVIWHNLDGACSLRELIADLAEVFEVDADVVRADVLDTVRELSRHGMLEAATAPASEQRDMIWRRIGEPAFLVEGPVGCASCVERLGELEWGDTITFEIGGVHIGVRTNAPEVDAVLRLALRTYLANDVEAPANFSLRIGEQQGRGREGLHILYDASEQLARSSAPSRVVSALFAHLASHEASYEAGTGDSLLPLRIPAVVVDGVAVLVSRHLGPIVLDVEPRLRASGLELVENPVLAVDTETRELVVLRPAIALDPGTPMALTDLDRALSTGRTAPRPASDGRYPLAGWITIDHGGEDHQAAPTRPAELIELLGLVENIANFANVATLEQLDRVFPLHRRVAVPADAANDLAEAIIDAAGQATS